MRPTASTPKVGLIFTGIFYAWMNMEALRITADLPGGLTRTNLMLAAHSLDLVHPHLIDGIKFRVDGTEDAFYIEGSDFSVYSAADQSWKQVGGIVDMDGSSPLCPWDAANSAEGCGAG